VAINSELLWAIAGRVGLAFYWAVFYGSFFWFFDQRNYFDILLPSLLLIFGLVLILTPKKIYKSYWLKSIMLFLGLTALIMFVQWYP